MPKPQPTTEPHKKDLQTALVLEECLRTIRLYRQLIGEHPRDCACGYGAVCAWHATTCNYIHDAEELLEKAAASLRRPRE